MSIGTGRDPQANTLLQNTPSSVQLVMPSICYMEALSALEQEQKYRRRLENEINLQISQLRRDVTSTHARNLLALLEQSKTENKELIKDVEMRIFEAIHQIASKVQMIELTAETIRQHRVMPLFDQDHTDNLLLYCILHHAYCHPTESKAFLSSNSREFRQVEVQDALRNAGVTNYFTRTQDFLAWLQSQPSS